MNSTKSPYDDFRQHRAVISPEVQALMDNAVKVPFEHKKLTKRRQHFVKVPWPWVEALFGATGATFSVAMVLLYAHFRQKGPIKLANCGLTNDGVTRWSKWRGLGELERRGLVRVERRRRKSPIVYLLKL